MRYAIACLEREAEQLLRDVQLFLVPTAAYCGDQTTIHALHDRASWMFGRAPEKRTVAGADPEVTARVNEARSRMERAMEAGDVEAAGQIEHELNEWVDEYRSVKHQAQKAAGYWEGDVRQLSAVRRWISTGR